MFASHQTVRLAQIEVCTDCSGHKESLLSSAEVLMKTSRFVIIYANAVEIRTKILMRWRISKDFVYNCEH